MNYLVIKILAILVIVVIRFAIKGARSSASASKPYTPQQSNQSFKQPPPYNPTGQTQQSATPNYRDTFTSPENFNPAGNNPQPAASGVYCMYCGKKFQSTNLLLMDTCFKHPNSESGLQKHVLYRGVGKPNIGF